MPTPSPHRVWMCAARFVAGSTSACARAVTPVSEYDAWMFTDAVVSDHASSDTVGPSGDTVAPSSDGSLGACAPGAACSMDGLRCVWMDSCGPDPVVAMCTCGRGEWNCPTGCAPDASSCPPTTSVRQGAACSPNGAHCPTDCVWPGAACDCVGGAWLCMCEG
jgi:hypothetical protein